MPGADGPALARELGAALAALVREAGTPGTWSRRPASAVERAVAAVGAWFPGDVILTYPPAAKRFPERDGGGLNRFR